MKRSPLRRSRKPLKRRVKLRARKVPKAFAKHRDYTYRRHITQMPCVLAGCVLGRAISLNDVSLGLAWRGFEHRCWGPIDPAHVGQHQATGADDLGVLLPLCRAAHRFYDERRLSFYRVTGYTAQQMAEDAARLGTEYAARKAVTERWGA